MNFIIQMVFFVAICAAVFPGSSAVPVDKKGQEDQVIMMRADSENKEFPGGPSKFCQACLVKCWNAVKPIINFPKPADAKTNQKMQECLKKSCSGCFQRG